MPYLLIDIGNSRIKIAIATENERLAKTIMSTGLVIEEPLDEFILQYITSHSFSIGSIRTALISSVVPEYNATITMACSRLGIEALFLTHDIKIPLQTAFSIPPMTGVDRLLLSYGASILYEGAPCIVVSFGTATTFNCVEKFTFQGGLIFPGVMQSLQALLQNASQLREMRIALHTKEADDIHIAHTTEQSIEQGITQGFASMTEGLLEKLSHQFQHKPHYIAAGGMSTILSSYTTCFERVQEDLVLDAMWYLTQREDISSLRI